MKIHKVNFIFIFVVIASVISYTMATSAEQYNAAIEPKQFFINSETGEEFEIVKDVDENSVYYKDKLNNKYDDINKIIAVALKNDLDKLDEQLKIVFESNSDSDELVNINVIFYEQAPYSIVNNIYKKYEDKLNKDVDEIKSIMKDYQIEEIESGTQTKEIKSKEVQTIQNIKEKSTKYEKSQIEKVSQLPQKTLKKDIRLKEVEISESDKVKILERGFSIEATNQKIREEIKQEMTSVINQKQKETVNLINELDGIVLNQKITFNMLNAELPIRSLDELSRDKKIKSILLNRKNLVPKLDVSVPSIYASVWWTGGYNGSWVDVAVADTGVDKTHPNLEVDTEGNSRTFYEKDFSDSGTTDDRSGHGTHVAGIIASSHSTYKGVASGVDALINAKWIDTGGTFTDAVDALDWATVNVSDPAEVLSNSWGCSFKEPDSSCTNLCPEYGTLNGESDLTHFMDALADNYNIINVLSAGNEGDCGDTSLSFPGDAYNIIVIGSINDGGTTSRSDDTISTFSSLGTTSDGRKKPDLAAPGSSITSLAYNWEGANLDTSTKSGTSMAAPHVSAVAALLTQYGLTPKEVKALLIQTAEDKGTVGWDKYYGWGYINLSRAFTYKLYTIKGNVTEGSYKFYKIQLLLPNEKATLVWNRHIPYNPGGNYPTTSYSVNDLDLYFYRESTNSIISSSVTTKDNVEQVQSDSTYLDGILKVDGFSTNFSHGLDIEDYALGTDGGYSLATGPILNITQKVPSTASTLVNFTITATVTNNGDLKAHNVGITLNLPTGLTILSGATTQSYNISASSSAIATWIINATNGVGEYRNINSSFSSTSYGEMFTGKTPSNITNVILRTGLVGSGSSTHNCSTINSTLKIDSANITNSIILAGNNVNVNVKWVGWHFYDDNHWAFFLDSSTTPIGTCKSFNDDTQYNAYDMNCTINIPSSTSKGIHTIKVTSNDYIGYCNPGEAGTDVETSFRIYGGIV